MNTQDTQDRERERPSLGQFALRWSLLLGAFAGLFLLGCFVVGPRLSKGHPGESPQVQTAAVTEQPSKLAPSSRGAASRTEPKPVVTIREEQPRQDAAPQETQPESVHREDVPAIDEATPPPVLTPPSGEQSEPPPAAANQSQNLNRVRVGLFADRQHADDLSQKLSDAGYSPSVLSATRDGRQLYSVQAGAFRDRQNADGLAESLRQSGFEAWVTSDE